MIGCSTVPWCSANCTRASWRDAAINALAFAPDGRWLASAAGNHLFDLWRPGDGAHLRSLAGHRAPVTGCSAHPGSEWIAFTAADGELRIWSASTGECLSAVRVDGALLACAFSDEGRSVVAVGANGLYLFGWVTGG